MKIPNFYIVIIFCFSYLNVVGQSNNKENLNDVMDEISQLYDGETRPPGMLKFKHHARWAYWWSSRVNPDGTFNDVVKKNQEALEKFQKDNPSETRGNSANWNFIGPDISTYATDAPFCKGNGYGRVDRVSFHPTNANKIYVCTPDGGAWYSPNKGSSWQPLSDNLPILGCAGIVVDPDDDQTLYLLTGTTDNTTRSFVTLFGYRYPSIGVMKSTDHGENWERILDFTEFTENSVVPYRIKIHPLDSDVILVATSRGMYRTEDKGQNWEQVLTSAYVDIEFHPTDEDYIYASGFRRVLYSDDKGNSDSWAWSNGFVGCTYPGPSSVNARVELAVTPHDPDAVYMIAGRVLSSTTFCGYSKSTNKGVSFPNPITTPNIIGYGTSDQSNYDLCIAVDNNNKERVVVGGLQIFKTDNYNSGSVSWTNIAEYWEDTGNQEGTLPDNYVHPDVHDVAFNPLDGSIYTCSDGGVYRSTNNGASWNNISQGIHTSQIFNMNTAPSNSSKIGIGLQDNGTKVRYSSNSQDFKHIYQADGFEPDFSPNNSLRMAVSLNKSLYLIPNTNDTNAVFITSGDFFNPVRFKTDDEDKVYYNRNGTLRSVTFDSNDDINSTSFIGGMASWVIETCPSDGNRLYSAGGNDGLENDSDGKLFFFLNENALDRSTTTGFPDNNTLVKITDIAVNPNDCGDVVFSNGGYEDGEKVYFSNTSGASTWQNWSYNLPNTAVHALVFDDDENLYAGTDIGVFYLPQGTTIWLPFYNGMPRAPLSDLSINNQGTKIIAATFGRGIYESFLPTSCSVSQLVTEDLLGPHFYETSTSIIGRNIIHGGLGTEVRYKAGQKVILEPGFNAKSGSRFKAHIADCGDDVDN